MLPPMLHPVYCAQDLVEMTRVTLIGATSEAKLLGALETLIETTQDFTDSAYTSHENRERILALCERLRQELATLLRVGHNVVSHLLSVHQSAYSSKLWYRVTSVT